MPRRARRPCGVFPCKQFRPCPIHPERPRQESAARRGYGPDWERASAEFVRLHPWCVDGCGRRSEVVDHREPHGGDPVKFWDRSNWQPMSRHCHGRKTAKYDGGYGNPRKAIADAR